MKGIIKYYSVDPVDQSGGSLSVDENKKVRNQVENSKVEDVQPKEQPEEKSIFQQALQDWANDNAADIEEDNNTPLNIL